MTTADINSITALYVTYFGHAPDPTGLDYWVGQGKANVSLETIADAFGSAQESKTRYPYLAFPNISDPTAFVKSIYVNAFGRQPEAGGLDYFVNQLNTQGASIAPTFILTVLLNAQGTDRIALQNKVTIATQFTNGLLNNSISPTTQIFADSTTILNTINETPASLTAGNLSVNAKITDYITVGTTTALTTSAADNLVGTAANDTFIGNIDVNGFGGSGNSTIQATDKIDGGAGIDTFIYTGYYPVGYSLSTGIFPSLSNVENVELLNTFGNFSSIDLTALTGKGVQQVTLVTPVNQNGTLAVTGLSGITFGVQGIATSGADPFTVLGTIQPNFGTTATSATVSIKDAILTNLDLSASTTVTTLNIVADGLGKNKISTLTAAGVKTLNISGAGALEITGFSGTPALAPTTINASTNTGGVIITAATATTATTITGGAGNDTLTGGSVADILTGGAGNDTINGSLLADILTGGAGKDTFRYGAITTTDSTGGTQTGTVSFDTITDFTVADDTLKLASLTLSTNLVAQTTVEAAVTALPGTPTFAQALSAAATAIGSNKFGAFRFGSNTYVLGTDNGAVGNVDSADQLIALTGNLVLTNANFGL